MAKQEKQEVAEAKPKQQSKKTKEEAEIQKWNERGFFKARKYSLKRVTEAKQNDDGSYSEYVGDIAGFGDPMQSDSRMMPKEAINEFNLQQHNHRQFMKIEGNGKNDPEYKIVKRPLAKGSRLYNILTEK